MVIEMKLFIVDNKGEDLKCGGCNWGCSTFYSFGNNKKGAKNYFEVQQDLPEEYGKGLCVSCICDMLVRNKIEIGVK